MADAPKQDVPPAGGHYQPPKPPPKQNPAFRALGMPNWRFKLPSRNWMIFLTITGSWTAAVVYDKQQKKKLQKKWCDLVAHIAQEKLPVNQMPRKLTIFLSAPPGDGIGPSRQYFKEYVKPILVAAAMDYDVIEGRKEGDVRYGTAEQIRRYRRRKGERGTSTEEEEPDTEQAIEMVREKMHIMPEPGMKGDLVLGRHTWKEYVRGLHEGWLGPLDEPPEPEPEVIAEPSPVPSHPSTSEETQAETGQVEEKKEDEKKDEEKKEEKKKPSPPSAYIPINAYSSAPLSPHIPTILEPSNTIYQQHLLGFLKTPQRIYNFLNRHKLADDIGRQTAAIVLGAHRPYRTDESFVSTSTIDIPDSSPIPMKAPETDADVIQSKQTWEQQTPLLIEEATWHKSVRKPRKEDDRTEQIWMTDVVLDPRIAERMRKFEIDPEEEARADRIVKGIEKGRAREIEDLRQEKVKIGEDD